MAEHDLLNPGRAAHVAIIMDGNGRWAEARGLARIYGHESGLESVRAVTRHGAKIGLDQLTLYAFSTENWKRPQTEVDFLMVLLERYLELECDELMENDIRLTSIGRIDGLPTGVQRALRSVEALTASNGGTRLCLALNYGSRTEIADAARSLARDARLGRIDPDALDSAALERELSRRMYQPKMPPVDLLIRTAGEQRLSNYLLWQLAYAEIWLTETRWPDFREEDLDSALASFATRVRRFGGLAVKGD